MVPGLVARKRRGKRWAGPTADVVDRSGDRTINVERAPNVMAVCLDVAEAEALRERKIGIQGTCHRGEARSPSRSELGIVREVEQHLLAGVEVVVIDAPSCGRAVH